MHFVIVGGGHAAGLAAAALRQNGFDGACTIVGDEVYAPYQRPPLSKQFLSGEYNVDRMLLRPVSFYESKQITLRTGSRVTRIDTAAATLELANATTLAYDRLLLATGTRARRLDLPGATLAGICYLRNIDDAERLRPELAPGRRLVIVGGGYVGLEVAAVAVARGMHVTVLEVQSRILERVATAELAALMHAMQARRGVDVRCGERVLGFEGDGRVERVVTASGSLPADVVLVGVGAQVNDEVAVAAGIACDNGILADAHCRTSVAGVFAAGDVCRGFNTYLDRQLRIESVPNATEQARVAASAMLDREARCEAVPWFWSDQFDWKLQMAGLTADAERCVLRGNAAASADLKTYIAFHLAGHRIVAVDAINSPREFLTTRQLIEKRVPVRDDDLANPEFDVRTLLR